MKKNLYAFIFLFLISASVFAGGIVTNSNLSAAYVRSMVRDASIQTDAVYYNPAGLVRMEDGFYIEVNNQSIFQTKTITNEYQKLNNNTYVGDVMVPLFPSAYAVWKKGNLAIFGGYAIFGGGGSAEYKTGLPSFEMPISDLKAKLSKAGVTEYTSDIYFKGASSYMGFQIGASYKINEFIAVGLGCRYIIAKNTYEGYVKDIKINPGGGEMMRADAFFTSQASALQPAIDGTQQMLATYGTYTFGMINPGDANATFNSLEDGLAKLGYTEAQIDAMDINKANAVYKGAQKQMTDGAAITSDKKVDAEQKGNSYTPIISVDLSMLNGDLGIALKYEHNTPMELKNSTTVDGTGMFPDGEKLPAEMPALISVGIRYNILENFRTQIGFHYYMDKAAKYGKRSYILDPVSNKYIPDSYVTNGEEITLSDGTTGAYLDADSYELGIGIEYDVAKNITLSGGYLFASQSPTLAYQTDLSYGLKSNTFGFGAIAHISEKFDINLGILHTSNVDDQKTLKYTDPLSSTGAKLDVKEVYAKKTTIISIGFGYRF